MDAILPVARVTPARLPPTSLAGLAVGQVVSARVSRVDGAAVELRLGDRTLAAASRVPLAVGQEVSLVVEEAGVGKTLLRMVDDSLANSRAAAAGRQAGAPVTTPSPHPGYAPAPPIDPRFPLLAADAAPPGRSPSAVPGDAESEPSVSEPGGSPAAAPRSTALGDSVAVGADRLPGQASPPAAGSQFAPGGTTARLAGDEAPVDGEAASQGTARLAGHGAPVGGRLLADAGPAARPWSGVARSAPDGAASQPAETPGRASADEEAPGQTAGAAQAAGTGAAPGPDPLLALAARAALPAYSRYLASRTARPAAPQSSPEDPPAGADRAPGADVGAARSVGRTHPDAVERLVELLRQRGAGDGRPPAAGAGLPSLSPESRPARLLLARLGLSATPQTIRLARQLLAGEHAPGAAWVEALGTLERLSRAGQLPAAAARLVDQSLAAWSPARDEPGALASWLERALRAVGTPLEARLVEQAGDERALASWLGSAGEPFATEPGTATIGPRSDVRLQLQALQRAVAEGPASDAAAASRALERLQRSVEAEQILNAARPETTGPRYFVFTLPAARQQPAGTIELRVRERPAGSADGPAEAPQTVQLRLALPRLGELQINLTVRGAQVACRFVAGAPFAAALLSASAPELAQRLHEVGYDRPAINSVQGPTRPPSGGVPPSPPTVDSTT